MDSFKKDGRVDLICNEKKSIATKVYVTTAEHFIADG